MPTDVKEMLTDQQKLDITALASSSLVAMANLCQHLPPQVMHAPLVSVATSLGTLVRLLTDNTEVQDKMLQEILKGLNQSVVEGRAVPQQKVNETRQDLRLALQHAREIVAQLLQAEQQDKHQLLEDFQLARGRKLN